MTGPDNDWNAILDNEIYDWGDGVAVAGVARDCNFPGRPHGTVIDGNDIYLTGAKRIDCATGAPDPAGDCSCAENGIDVKPAPGADPARRTRITNNRLWGFRPTREPSTCGGSGSNGQAITAGNDCPGHLLVAGDVVTDNLALGAYGGRRGVGHETQHNFLCDSPIANFATFTNEIFATVEESRNTEFRYWRKRWTAPERACVPFGWTTTASPQAAALASCEPELVAPLGLPPIGYASILRVPEPSPAALAAAAGLALLVVRPRSRVRSAGRREEPA